MTSETTLYHDGSRRFTVLGICWLLYGVLRLLLAMWLATFTPVATVMFGALLSRVADPFSLMSTFHMFYLFAIILSALCGVIGFLAGLALLAGQDSGRGLALVASLLSLCELPVGLTLGVYTLITLLPVRVVPQDRRHLRAIEASPSPAR